jgi:type I restriction enzyme M protein
MASIPMDKGGDTFGLIYEYFLGKFAMSEGQKGGEFYTPTAIVRLIVEILEPYHGLIFDPACGSGGMFIQSARFVEEHRKNPTKEISVHGQERVTDTSRLARLNLAVHGLSGEIKQGNTYYEDLQDSVGRFDFVMANPPFNVSKIDKERLAGDPRYPFGIPRTDNGNYLWIQHFHSALNAKGRAGFVMANSAADARASEQEIREKLIRSGDVDVMVSIGPNFFYTVTLPCTLWFFDKGKSKIDNQKSSIGNRKDTVLFIDARHIFRQLDRAHRDFNPAQIEFIANLVRLYRGQPPEFHHGSESRIEEFFGTAATSSNRQWSIDNRQYQDVPGLCKAATLAEIEAQGWSLNPGRYVGVAKGEDLSDEDFKEKLEALNEELEVLNAEARELEARIAENVTELLEA